MTPICIFVKKKAHFFDGGEISNGMTSSRRFDLDFCATNLVHQKTVEEATMAYRMNSLKPFSKINRSVTL